MFVSRFQKYLVILYQSGETQIWIWINVLGAFHLGLAPIITTVIRLFVKYYLEKKIVKTKKVRNFIHLIYSAARYHQQDKDSWEWKNALPIPEIESDVRDFIIWMSTAYQNIVKYCNGKMRRCRIKIDHFYKEGFREFGENSA